MKYVPAIFILLLAFSPALSAHVGSPDVFVEGNAGPYKLFVTVRVPQVIPGVAEIEIRSESNDVREIRVAPMQLTGPGSQYPPAPEAAERSKNDPQFFRGSLWLMEFGSLQVRIDADGTHGKGQLAVPVPATAQSTLPMQRSLGTVLFILMVVLATALISIVAAAVREGDLEPGASLPARRKRQSRFAAVIAGVVAFALLSVGGLWWRSDAHQYAGNIYSPPEIDTLVGPSGALTLRAKPIRVASGNPRRPTESVDFSDLILDHEHLMHLFLIRSPGMDSFWHLHPARAALGGFAQNLPAMPPGHYQVFADVVLNTGFPVTLVGQLDLSSAIAGTPLSGDDSGIVATPITSDAPSSETIGKTECALADGGRMIWERDGQPLQAGVPLILRFRVADRAGNPASDLEPYMGMPAHAAIIRSDSSVFAHVHPTGSVPMASFELAQANLPGNLGIGGNGSMEMKMDMRQMTGNKVPPEISFPYGFPKPGLYRIFVQVKRSGRIQTAVFEALVK